MKMIVLYAIFLSPIVYANTQDCTEKGAFFFLHREGITYDQITPIKKDFEEDFVTLAEKYEMNVPWLPSGYSETYTRYQAIMTKVKSDGTLTDEEIEQIGKKVKIHLLTENVGEAVGGIVLSQFINKYKVVKKLIKDDDVLEIVNGLEVLETVFFDLPELSDFITDVYEDQKTHDPFKVKHENNLYALERQIKTYWDAGLNRTLILSHNYGSLIGNEVVKSLKAQDSLFTTCAAHLSLGSYISPHSLPYTQTQVSNNGFGYMNLESDKVLSYFRTVPYLSSIYPNNYYLVASYNGSPNPTQSKSYSSDFREYYLDTEQYFNVKNNLAPMTMIGELNRKLILADEYLDLPKAPIAIDNLQGSSFDTLTANFKFTPINMTLDELSGASYSWDTNGDGVVDCLKDECTDAPLPSPQSGNAIKLAITAPSGLTIEEELTWEGVENKDLISTSMDESGVFRLHIPDNIEALVDIDGDGAFDQSGGTEILIDYDDTNTSFFKWAMLEDNQPKVFVSDLNGMVSYEYSYNSDCEEKGFYIAPVYLQEMENPRDYLFLSNGAGQVSPYGFYTASNICSGSSLISNANYLQNVIIKSSTFKGQRLNAYHSNISESNIAGDFYSGGTENAKVELDSFKVIADLNPLGSGMNLSGKIDIKNVEIDISGQQEYESANIEGSTIHNLKMSKDSIVQFSDIKGQIDENNNFMHEMKGESAYVYANVKNTNLTNGFLEGGITYNDVVVPITVESSSITDSFISSPGGNISKATLTDGSSVLGGSLSDVVLSDAQVVTLGTISESNISSSEIWDSTVSKSEISGSNIWDSTIFKSEIYSDTNIWDSTISESNLTGCTINYSNISDQTLSGITMFDNVIQE